MAHVVVTIATFIFLASRRIQAFTPNQTIISFRNDHCRFTRSLHDKYSIRKIKPLYSDWKNSDSDSNSWVNSGDDDVSWEEKLEKKNDMWSTFSSSENDTDQKITNIEDGEDMIEAMVNINAEEIDFMNAEAERADSARQMQEWGFSSETISSTLDIAVDDSNEFDEDDSTLQQMQEDDFGLYIGDDIDPETVESHTTVEIDEETGEPVRTQMVYVDETACIGCYNCANVAQSTFFMESEHGRARVFDQWGDDDETIEIAIETCPVDCIHYIPYQELVDLEVGRREQNINPKARLVNQSNDGGGGSYTGTQQISGNMGSRCTNCPSRGCKDCPMFGIGKNPYFEEREKERKDRNDERKLRAAMQSRNKSVDL